MNQKVVEKFKLYFAEMDFDDDSILREIYSDDIIFKDPVHEIKGLESLIQYFNKLNENLIEGAFHFTDESIIDNKAYLSWEMNLALKRPKKKVKASGISVLNFGQKITTQRDYFDAGELFYENIPIFGGLIRFLKKKIAN